MWVVVEQQLPLHGAYDASALLFSYHTWSIHDEVDSKLCRLVSYGDSETSSPEASNQKERVLYPWLNGVTC